jgi:hypothetical protein
MTERHDPADATGTPAPAPAHEVPEPATPLMEATGRLVIRVEPPGTESARGVESAGRDTASPPQVMDVHPRALPNGSAPPEQREESPAPPRRWPRIAAVVAAITALGAFLGGLLSMTHPGPRGTGATVAREPVTGSGAFPSNAESALLARFPAFAEGCHRYANHYAKAVAEVECFVSPDHPGARTIVYQDFANYQDLEEHFHHVLALTIQAETGRSLSTASTGACSDAGSRFFALSNYPAAGETQDRVSSPTARGHVVCYLDSLGVPHTAWTNVGWLVVAQATGDDSGTAAQRRLLANWEFAGPTGTPVPDLAVTRTPAAVVSALYQRYLLRAPEDGQVLQFWTRRLKAVGFAQVSNELAASAEAKQRITLPITQGLGHGH